jgi:hypothetical protein
MSRMKSIVLMFSPQGHRDRGDFHVGFVLERSADVGDVYDRLKAAGVPMKLDIGVQGAAVVFQCVGSE